MLYLKVIDISLVALHPKNSVSLSLLVSQKIMWMDHMKAIFHKNNNYWWKFFDIKRTLKCCWQNLSDSNSTNYLIQFIYSSRIAVIIWMLKLTLEWCRIPLLFNSNSSSFTSNLCGFPNGVFIRNRLTRMDSSPLYLNIH